MHVADKESPTFDYLPFLGVCNTAWNAVEGDQFYSAKRIVTVVDDNGYVYGGNIAASRKWTSDWYAFDPYQTSWDWACDHPHQWATKWQYGTKGWFRVWRMN